MISRSESKLLSFPNLLTAGFFVLVLAQVWNHIMWRDELRPWQIIKECSTPMQVVEAMKYDAVPLLWNLIVYVLTRFGDYPFLMQFAHACIATGVIYVVARWGPLSRAHKVLFSLGYFPFFEYATIARNYSLVFLLMMIACVILTRGRIRWWGLAAVACLLTQVSIWGAAMGGLLLVVGAAISWTGPAEHRPKLSTLAGIGAIFLVGIGLCFYAILPGPGPSFTEGWRDVPWDTRIFRSIGSIYRAWVPIPVPQLEFWNTGLMSDFPVVQGIFGVVLFLLFAGMIARRPIALGWLIAATGLLVTFTALKFRGAARHDGVLFIVFITAWWLAQSGPQWEVRWTGWLERGRAAFLSIALALGAVGGVMAASLGMIYPFSATRAVANYIRDEIREPMTLLSYVDYASAPVSQWLDRPIYSVNEQREIYINTQNDEERIHYREVDSDLILNTAYQLLHSRNRPVLLMLNSTVEIRHHSPLLTLSGSPHAPPRQVYLLDVTGRPELDRSIANDEAHKLYIVRAAR